MRFQVLTGKPVLVSEFYMCAQQNRSGNKNDRSIFPTLATQGERITGFRNTVLALLRIPYVIGADWFQYYDEPTHGRGDGENFNFGLVDINDQPTRVLPGPPRCSKRLSSKGSLASSNWMPRWVRHLRHEIRWDNSHQRWLSSIGIASEASSNQLRKLPLPIYICAGTQKRFILVCTRRTLSRKPITATTSSPKSTGPNGLFPWVEPTKLFTRGSALARRPFATKRPPTSSISPAFI